MYNLSPPLAVESGDIFGAFQPGIAQSQSVFLYQQYNGPPSLIIPLSDDITDDSDIPDVLTNTNLVNASNNDFPLVSIEFSMSIKLIYMLLLFLKVTSIVSTTSSTVVITRVSSTSSHSHSYTGKKECAFVFALIKKFQLV